MHRKRKLSVSGPATKATLIKKFKEEIEAEKRKKIRLDWYLKQLLLEKEMLVKENEIEFAQAMQSFVPFDAAVPTTTFTTSSRPITSAPVSLPVMTSPTPVPATTTPSSLDDNFDFFEPSPVKIEETSCFDDSVASPGPTTEDYLDELPSFAPPVEESKPLEEFSTEWEQTHCWWDEDELSQFLAVPPSLMV
jgi:hypothetical protein